MPAAPVVGAVIDFTPGISVLINPFTLDSAELGVLGTNCQRLRKHDRKKTGDTG